jgi:hypothetical protein
LIDDEGIYHAQGNLREKFDYKVDNLRDKKVLSFNSVDIQAIIATKDDQTHTFTRTEEPGEQSPPEKSDPESAAPLPKKIKIVWQTADGKNVDENRLNRLLSTLSNLSCEKYIDGRKKNEFTSPIYTIVLKGLSNYSLSVFETTGTDNENYAAISSDNDYPFELSKWQAEQIMKTPDEIVEHLTSHNDKDPS